jgi:hypothetical protein
LNSPLHHSPLFSPPPIPGIVSTGIIFQFTVMCTQYLHYIHPPTPFLHLLTPSYWYQPHPIRQNLFPSSCSLVLQKKWHFCLFKIATQGVSLWYFYVFIYSNLNWFISSIFLLFTLVPFIWWFQ